jgi:hypothetical protein
MRAALVLGLGLLAAGACTPDIAPGSYLCGPDQVCPDDQACDGPTNTCVLPSQVQPFACPTGATEAEPNNDATNAQRVVNLTCVSRTAEVIGCAKDLDGEDWFQFDVPADCTTVGIDARLTFPLAFEVLALELRSDTGATLATGEACFQAEPDDGDEQRCLEHTLTPGGHYAIRIARTGEGVCGGACAYNRYTLTLQLETP